MESVKSQLLAMGFDEGKIKRALESCSDSKNLEQVMEWLIAHEDELNNDTSPVGNSTNVTNTAEPKNDNKSSSSLDTSQQTGEHNETAANMAARKKITVEEAQRIITERQVKRVEEERKKEIEDEKRRRIDGQKMAETRAELQDLERIRLAQQIRKEKLEKEMHRKQVLEQIARDREAMKNKEQPQTTDSSSRATSSQSCGTNSSQPPKAAATECKIALRFPDGSNKIQKFSPQEQLSAVKKFVQTEKATTGDVEFVAPPNKKLTDSMMNETLESLGLCPASRLEVKYTSVVWSHLD